MAGGQAGIKAATLELREMMDVSFDHAGSLLEDLRTLRLKDVPPPDVDGNEVLIQAKAC